MYVFMYACMYVGMYACMPVCMNVCLYVDVYVRESCTTMKAILSQRSSSPEVESRRECGGGGVVDACYQIVTEHILSVNTHSTAHHVETVLCCTAF